MTEQELDVVAMRVHLHELKSAFDTAINNGGVFQDIKKIYMHIKELECRLNVMDWQSGNEIKSRTP